MNFPDTPREQIVASILQGATGSVLEVQESYSQQARSRVTHPKTTLRERLEMALDVRRATQIFELGSRLCKIGVGFGVVSVASEVLVQNHDVATASGLLGGGFLVIGALTAAQA